MPIFSRPTLEKFEDASASIPLRNISRAFDRSNIRIGEDPGGPVGSRRTHFRCYVAGVDQFNAQQLDRLGDALGALIEEVAASKVEFLVKAAQSDGFVFANGVFRAAETNAISFAVTHVADVAFIEECGRQLHVLANDRPVEAVGGAKELVESLCVMVLRLLAKPVPKGAELGEIAAATLDALQSISARSDDKNASALVRRCFQDLGDLVAMLSKLQIVDDSGQAHDDEYESRSIRYARLAVGATLPFARFVAETYLEFATTDTADAS